MALLQYLGTGRRKRAVARVFLRPGTGKFTVNGRPADEYFTTFTSRTVIRQPLLATETADKFDVLVTCRGGGIAGQADAVRLGIARALCEFNSELRAKLKQEGYLTRDPREHERKKYGQRGARRRFQFSKR
ncbi:MAG: 30S ribosomal protein S9 [Bryobacteraceae bacterium]|nr:30S ribosomal protein S9 [Bryobacteraceae bacterium]GIU76452.1 MAG: 30S ribosomal protein S9 [Bryobacteraceae bacterium]